MLDDMIGRFRIDRSGGSGARSAGRLRSVGASIGRRISALGAPAKFGAGMRNNCSAGERPRRAAISAARSVFVYGGKSVCCL